MFIHLLNNGFDKYVIFDKFKIKNMKFILSAIMLHVQMCQYTSTRYKRVSNTHHLRLR